MKNLLKKLGITIAAAAYMLMLPAIVSYAADGTLQFSDPTGKVGEEITVTAKMAENGGNLIGDGDATVTYDPSMLEFVRGTNASGSDGTVTLSAAGTGSETELSYEMVFKALAEGSTTLQVTGSTAYMFDDNTLNLEYGTSTITIEAGDGTAGASGTIQQGEADIEISGTMYAVYENFTDALIPDGFSRTTMQYNGTEHNAIAQDSTGKTVFFLVTGSNDPVMALYEESTNSLVVAEQVNITDEFYILILGMDDGSSLPDNFAETTLELNGTIFPAWQNMDSPEYYLMYALSSAGDEGFYQYDTKEGTYQRYVVPEVVEEEEPDTSLLGKAKTLLDQYFLIAAAVVGVLILLLLIIIIVQSIKLGRCNAELDELYDEYDTDDKPQPAAKKSRKQFVGYDDEEEDDAEEDEFIEDDFDEYEDDEYDDEYDGDDEYDDEYEDDDEYDDEYDEDDEYEDDEYDDDDEDDDISFIDL